MGLSLWLVPTAEQSAKLSWLMHIRPPTAKMFNSYPRFHPHITLVTVPSTTPVEELVAAIPSRQSQVKVAFSDVVVSNAYFRSVLATIEPSPYIMSLQTEIVESLKIRNPPSPMFPHMSIYYIDDTEAEERTRILQELEANGTVIKTEEGVQIHTSVGPVGVPTGPETRPEPHDDALQGFDGAEIWVALCDGPVESWTVLEKVVLH
ncbi:2',3'-cyclic-nucleotide 3'-phosphodiesterase [Thelephora terrestris]|uniref:2',3'-cyclic-nucleotide 3'-phosphodiesterase n=1 Tax=Thelephora terrestris TaxID=56493 RepID=A0A9P6LBG2_9AGAM|nr:2',3'-cyclic-nucleotide 3'-phosphodiesterase [Thelephora terrestris]